jgi:zinc protease
VKPILPLTCGFLMLATMTSADKPDRTKRPPVGRPPAVATPRITKLTLSNDLPLWIVRRPQLPMVTAVLQIRAGAAMDGDHPGRAAMTAALLDDGTARRGALAFAEAVDFLGASLGASAGGEQTVVSMLTLSRHLDSTLALLGEMVTQPAFLPEEIERERKSRLQSLKQQRDLPAVVATQTFDRVVYGEDHPYGRPAAGTLASIEAIRRDDLLDFYQRYYRPNNAVLIVVGDVDEKTLPAQIERALGGWKPQPVPDDTRSAPPRPAGRERTVYLVDKPGAAQSEIRIGHAGAARTTTPDYYALQVMNTLLGGQFTSRINLNLRERHGFTYGARSAWSFRRGDGPFVASTGVFTAKSDSAIAEMLKELEDIRGPRPASAEEAAMGRNALIRSYPRRLETNDGVATVLAELALFDLPESEIAGFNQRVAKVRPDQVTSVASRYIDPAHLAVVVVGDVAKIRPGIEALGIGPVKVLDPDGRETAP